MAKRFKNNERIPVTARQLHAFLYARNGKLRSRDYDKLKRMELVESPVRDAIWELKQYPLETLAHCFDASCFGHSKRIYARLDSEDEEWFHFSVAYIPRVLNNRDINDAIMRIFFIGKWRVDKRYLLADYESNELYGLPSNEIFLQKINR